MRKGDWQIMTMTTNVHSAYEADDGKWRYRRSFTSEDKVQEWLSEQKLTLIEEGQCGSWSTRNYRRES